METDILIFGHQNPDTDTICSSIAKQILNQKEGINNVNAVRIGKINKETKYVLDYLKMEEPEYIEEIQKGQEVILVDHNSFTESVKGIENAKIVEIVDHHRIAQSFETNEPIFGTFRPYGCTSTILYNDFVQKGIAIEKTEALLMASAIISDTLLLKSPTTTKKDKEALKELSKIANINPEEYGIAMLKAGTDLDDFSETELINLDAKILEQNGRKIMIAQVNTVDIEKVLERKRKLEEAMNVQIEEKGLDLIILAITDILNSNSQIIALGELSKITEKAYGHKLENNTMFLEGVVSRKKQLLPQIVENL